MIDLVGFLLGGVLPALVAAVTMVAVFKRTQSSAAAWSIAIAVGYLSGHWGLDARGVGLLAALAKMIRPHEARDWLPILILVATTIDAISRIVTKHGWLTWSLRLGLIFILPWCLLRGSVYLPVDAQPAGFDTGAWSTWEAVGWLGAVGGLLAVAGIVVRFGVKNPDVRLRSTLGTIALVGTSATIAMSGSLTTAQLLGALAAAMVGCGIVAAWLRLESGPESAAGPLLSVIGGVLVIARFLLYQELATATALLLLLALTSAVGWLGTEKKPAPRIRSALRIAICLAALAMALVPAAREFAATQTESEANPYLNYQP